jgi:hypothetical protein
MGTVKILVSCFDVSDATLLVKLGGARPLARHWTSTCLLPHTSGVLLLIVGCLGFVREALAVGRDGHAYKQFQMSVRYHKEVLEELRTRNPPVTRWVDRVFQLHECALVREATIPFLLDTHVPRERTLKKVCHQRQSRKTEKVLRLTLHGYAGLPSSPFDIPSCPPSPS